MIRRTILALAATCAALALCAQTKYNISDNEQILSKNERRSIEQMIDYELAFYNNVFGQGSISKEAVKMTILKDYPTYVFYLDQAGIKANKNSSGVYSPKLNEVVMWRGDKTSERFLTTCYHEMSHAILHSKMKSPEAWFNEGLASWFGYTKVTSKGTRHEPHRYYEDRVKTLIEIRDIDLKDFITWNHNKFSQASFSQDSYGYAVAYCMISLLKKNNEEALCSIIREVAGGKSSAEAFESCYPGGFAAFEKEFMAKYA